MSHQLEVNEMSQNVPPSIESQAKLQTQIVNEYLGKRSAQPHIDTKAGDQVVHEYLDQFKRSQEILAEYGNKQYKMIMPGEIPGFGTEWIPEELLDTPVAVEPDPEACYYPQTYRAHLASGSTTWDAAIMKEIYRKLWYRATRELSVGLNVVYTENATTLELGWLRPNELTFEYPLPIESGIGNIQTLTYWGYGMGLKLGSMSMYITDASMANNQVGQFRADFMRRQAEAVALSVDNNILSAFWNASFAVLKDVGTNFKWDGSGANQPDIIQDFATTQATLLNQTYKPEGELTQPVYTIVPLTLRPYVTSRPGIVQGGSTAASPAILTEGKVINDVTGMGFNLFYTRNATFANDAACGYKGPDTLIHATYNGSEIPLMEQERWRAKGTVVTWKRLFNTQFVPSLEGDTTSRNIGQITDLFAD
jgi:hypothetical protein